MTLLFAILLLGAAPAAGATPCTDARTSAALELARKGEALPSDTLAAVPAECLRVLRNAPFARHGRKFNDPALAAFFAKQKWYRARAEFTEATLTDVDRANAERVRGREQHVGLRAALVMDQAMIGLQKSGPCPDDDAGKRTTPLNPAVVLTVACADGSRHVRRATSLRSDGWADGTCLLDYVLDRPIDTTASTCLTVTGDFGERGKTEAPSAAADAEAAKWCADSKRAIASERGEQYAFHCRHVSADFDGDGVAEALISTTDVYVHLWYLLRPGSPPEQIASEGNP